jgi:outer membrane protein W
VPLTYDFNTIGTGNYAINPYLGAGVGGAIGEDSTAEFAVVAGADYRFAKKYVANGSVNYSPFANSDEIGFSVGVGRIF